MANVDGPSEGRPGADAIRGHLRLAGHRRVSHGLFLPHVPGLSAQEEFLRDLGALREVLPDSATFTHVTGARVLGWQLPALPEQVPVFASVAGDVSRPQRPGLIYSRLVRPSMPALVHGLPVELPEEILLRAARELGLLDLLILLDSARRQGHVDVDRMKAVLASTRPGVRMLRQTWDLSDPRADSGPETLLRAFHVVMDIPVEPQAILRDSLGRVIGQADLRIVGTNDLQEYDGGVHRPRKQQKVDLRRDRGLTGAGYVRRGYTLDDLLNYPVTVMQELDRRFDRPHRMSRVRRWQRLVENSLFSPTGRERVLNRWRRTNGITDWSETA
jgi:hypothetical protein